MAGSHAASTRPSRISCRSCWTGRWPPTGRCATRAQCWSCPSGARTAGWTAEPRAGWPTPHRVGRRCTGCCPTRLSRSWRCSTSGVRPTAVTASWPTAVPTWAGCGCRPRPCGECCSWRTSTSGRCPSPAAASADRSRNGRVRAEQPMDLPHDALHRSRDGGADRGGPGLPQVALDVVSAEETSTQVEVGFTQALDAEGLLELVDARRGDGRRRTQRRQAPPGPEIRLSQRRTRRTRRSDPQGPPSRPGNRPSPTANLAPRASAQPTPGARRCWLMKRRSASLSQTHLNHQLRSGNGPQVMAALRSTTISPHPSGRSHQDRRNMTSTSWGLGWSVDDHSHRCPVGYVGPSRPVSSTALRSLVPHVCE
jgi:hypothetical protein